MGAEADYIAESRGVSRADQDAFAVESHRRAIARSGAAARRDRAGDRHRRQEPRRSSAQDEGPRPDTTLEGWPSCGRRSATAARSRRATPRRSATARRPWWSSAKQMARDSRSPIKARIVASATSGVAPKEIFIAPVTAVRKGAWPRPS